MLEQAFVPTHNLAGAADHNSPSIDELFELATTRNLDVMLRKSLGIAIRLFKAEAGSLLFLANTTRRLRAGTFQHAALAQIDYWEESITKRLQQGPVPQPLATSPPIFNSKLDNGQLLINLPVLRDTKIIGGCLSLLLPLELKALTPQQQTFLHRLADSTGQIASLISDLEIAQQRMNQISVFYQVGEALITNFDLHKFLLDTMQLATNVVNAGASSLMLADEEKRELVFEVTHGARAGLLNKQRIPIDEGIAGWVASHGQPIVVNNPRTDPRFSYRVDVRTGFLTQSIAAVPLTIRGRTIGVLEVLNKYSGSGFDQDDVRVLHSIASQAAIAIENARLYEKIRLEHDHIMTAQEGVRREVMRNLHDGPIQSLSAMSMSLDHLELLLKTGKSEAIAASVETLRGLVNQATWETRQVLFELQPFALETQSLEVVLTQYAQELRESGNFIVNFTEIPPLDYDKHVARTIFSIVQEAINNIKQHANARNIWLTVTPRDNRCWVVIRDDGDGFDVAALQEDETKQIAVGLIHMREQAQLIEGDLQIESRPMPPHRGTTITLSLPAPAEKVRS